MAGRPLTTEEMLTPPPVARPERLGDPLDNPSRAATTASTCRRPTFPPARIRCAATDEDDEPE